VPPVCDITKEEVLNLREEDIKDKVEEVYRKLMEFQKQFHMRNFCLPDDHPVLNDGKTDYIKKLLKNGSESLEPQIITSSSLNSKLDEYTVPITLSVILMDSLNPLNYVPDDDSSDWPKRTPIQILSEKVLSKPFGWQTIAGLSSSEESPVVLDDSGCHHSIFIVFDIVDRRLNIGTPRDLLEGTNKRLSRILSDHLLDDFNSVSERYTTAWRVKASKSNIEDTNDRTSWSSMGRSQQRKTLRATASSIVPILALEIITDLNEVMRNNLDIIDNLKILEFYSLLGLVETSISLTLNIIIIVALVLTCVICGLAISKKTKKKKEMDNKCGQSYSSNHHRINDTSTTHDNNIVEMQTNQPNYGTVTKAPYYDKSPSPPQQDRVSIAKSYPSTTTTGTGVVNATQLSPIMLGGFQETPDVFINKKSSEEILEEITRNDEYYNRIVSTDNTSEKSDAKAVLYRNDKYYKKQQALMKEKIYSNAP